MFDFMSLFRYPSALPADVIPVDGYFVSLHSLVMTETRSSPSRTYVQSNARMNVKSTLKLLNFKAVKSRNQYAFHAHPSIVRGFSLIISATCSDNVRRQY